MEQKNAIAVNGNPPEAVEPAERNPDDEGEKKKKKKKKKKKASGVLVQFLLMEHSPPPPCVTACNVCCFRRWFVCRKWLCLVCPRKTRVRVKVKLPVYASCGLYTTCEGLRYAKKNH